LEILNMATRVNQGVCNLHTDEPAIVEKMLQECPGILRGDQIEREKVGHLVRYTFKKLDSIMLQEFLSKELPPGYVTLYSVDGERQ